MANVARAQDTSPQAVVSRYSKSTVQGVSALLTFEKAALDKRAPSYDSPEWSELTAAIAQGLPSIARAIAENDDAQAPMDDEVEGGELSIDDLKDPRFILPTLLTELGAAEVDDL